MEFVADEVARGPTFLPVLGMQHSFTHIYPLHTLPYIGTHASHNGTGMFSTTGWHTTFVDGSCLSDNFEMSVSVSVKGNGEKQVTFIGHLCRGLPT